MNLKLSPYVERFCVEVRDGVDVDRELVRGFSGDPLSLLFVMATPDIDLDQLCKSLSKKIPAKNIIGTKTAGEITTAGYTTGHVVAIGFRSEYFICDGILVKDIQNIEEAKLQKHVFNMRQNLASRSPNWTNDFAICVVDGLSRREDSFVSAVSVALGSIQLIGGSSGDGLDFIDAPLHFNGQTVNNAAVLAIIRTACEIKIFREDHFTPSEKRLIVTGADLEKRLVTEINAEPAAPEYARIVGIDPQQLTPFIFAAHPILVRIGDSHHVRAIQKVEGNDLRFFSAIDEGMVLTVANARNISNHLKTVLEELSSKSEPEQIFIFDCILRRLEAENAQESLNMSQLFVEHNVLGFSTYGEQHNMLHVNQTMTGIAIYAPKS